jgi:ribosomal protein L7Ae-like RNA K-turn-binding protein
MTLSHKTAALLGFAKKSGTLITGEFPVEQSIKNGQARLVILAEDIKDKKKDIIGKWCGGLGIACLIWGMRHTYGSIFNTQPQGFISVTDVQMARAILGSVNAVPSENIKNRR